MAATVWGVVEGGRVVPSSALPAGARVEIRLADQPPDVPEDLRAEFEAWGLASDNALNLVECLSDRGEAAALDPGHAEPVVVEVMVKVRALAFREPDGGYSVVVPEIDGCVTEGDSIEDVEFMVRDLAEALLEMKHDEARERVVREMNEPLSPRDRP